MDSTSIHYRELSGPCDAESIEWLARLHSGLLPTSPVTRMGKRFLEGFYYRELIADGTIWACLAVHDEKPCGFIAATDDARGFMRRAALRHPLKLTASLVPSLIARPGRIAALTEAGNIDDEMHEASLTPKIGEILSFGVIAEYRGARFIRETGVRIADALLGRAVEALAERGARRVRAVVDKDNTEVKFFYSVHEWEVENANLTGWRVPTMSFATNVSPARQGR